ncbi:MAG: hypothetical protein ACD_29C00084G0003 [uncultured bacterium]|nr:MAG: hypothetical protein ACD_29C00084G0003 [uncultured bacterium]OGT40553.1 MAG: hypothetical protein A3F12_07445 [Gammaproteobacteria bacterium RIFCSPHIGHO2_12_FULL_38_14]
MRYWNALLDNLNNPGRFFSDTEDFCIDDIAAPELFDASIDFENKNNPRQLKTYYISHEEPKIYFTKREAECIFWVMQNHTIAEAAYKMKLSPRTVEFYMKNAKLKLSCKTKKQFIEKILKTDLLAQLEKDGLKIKRQ